MRGRDLIKWLSVCVMTALVITLCGIPLPYDRETAVPAMASSPRGRTVYVDGTAIPAAFLSRDGNGTYVRADDFLTALDRDFWSGEALNYEAVSRGGEVYLCVEDFSQANGLGLYDADPSGDLWCSSAAGDWTVPEGISVPALMYHGVGDDTWTTPLLFVRANDLEEQLQWLLEQGYTPIWFSDLKHADQIQKPILLTFDDGWSDNYTELFPLLQKYRIKATFFVIVGNIGKNQHAMNAQQLRELNESGLVSLQCHSLYHPDLNTLSREEQNRELTWSKVELMKLTGRIPYVIAYPRGLENADTLSICRREYRFGVKMGGERYVTGDDPLLIHRIAVPRDMPLEDFIARLKSGN